MDVINKLIALVKEQPAIYDLRDAQHRNKEFLASIWNNIAAQMGMKVFEVKLKWQNLRSNYMREKRKIAANIKTTWPYFAQLSFLDGTLQYKQSIKSKKPEVKVIHFESTDSQEVKDEFSDFELTENDRLYEINNLTTYNEAPTDYSYLPENEMCEAPPPKKQALHDEDYIDTLHLQRLSQSSKEREPNKRKHSFREEEFSEMVMEDNDPDFLFLKSLLPSMKKLGHLQSLEFKGEVIQLLRNKLMNKVPTIEVVVSGSTSQGVQYDVKDFNKKSEDDVNLVVLQNVQSNLL